MAIDSKEKRVAVLGVGRPWMRDIFPIATPDEEWRISSGNAYGGNALAAGGGPTVIPMGRHLLDRQYAANAAHRLGGVLQ